MAVITLSLFELLTLLLRLRTDAAIVFHLSFLQNLLRLSFYQERTTSFTISLLQSLRKSHLYWKENVDVSV